MKKKRVRFIIVKFNREDIFSIDNIKILQKYFLIFFLLANYRTYL